MGGVVTGGGGADSGWRVAVVGRGYPQKPAGAPDFVGRVARSAAWHNIHSRWNGIVRRSLATGQPLVGAGDVAGTPRGKSGASDSRATTTGNGTTCGRY